MRVKFVNINGEMTALFPDDLADFKGNIMSYSHIGQPGAASPEWLNEPSLMDSDLYQELLSIGYEGLEIVGLGTLGMIEEESNHENKRIFMW